MRVGLGDGIFGGSGLQPPERSDVWVVDGDLSRSGKMCSKKTSVGKALYVFRHDDMLAGTERFRCWWQRRAFSGWRGCSCYWRVSRYCLNGTRRGWLQNLTYTPCCNDTVRGKEDISPSSNSSPSVLLTVYHWFSGFASSDIGSVEVEPRTRAGTVPAEKFG